MTKNECYTDVEVAQKLNKSVLTVWDMANLGQLPVKFVDDKRMFPKQAIDHLAPLSSPLRKTSERTGQNNRKISALSEVSSKAHRGRRETGGYFTPEQVAFALQRTDHDVRRMIGRGEIKATTISGRRWISNEGVEKFISKFNSQQQSWIRKRLPRPQTAIRLPEVTLSGTAEAKSADRTSSQGLLSGSQKTAESLKEDRRKVTEAAQRLGKSINDVRQMIAAGQLVQSPYGYVLAPDWKKHVTPKQVQQPSKNVEHRDQDGQVTSKGSDLQRELQAEREEKERLAEEWEQEREEYRRRAQEAQYEIAWLNADLENLRRDQSLQAETLQEDLEEERARRIESERRVEDLQEQLDEEIYQRWRIEDSTTNAPSNNGFYGRFRNGVREVVESLRDPASSEAENEEERIKNLESELGNLRSQLEDERYRASRSQQREEDLQAELEREKSQRLTVEESLKGLGQNEARTKELEKEKHVLDEIRKLLGTQAPQSLEYIGDGSPTVSDVKSDRATGELIFETPLGQRVFRPPFALEDQEVGLLRLVAEEDRITMDQIKHRTGRRRAADDLDDLLDRLADEGLEPIEKTNDRYSFDPSFLQNS